MQSAPSGTDLPCDDERSRPRSPRRARRPRPSLARLLCLRGLADPERGARASSTRRSSTCTTRIALAGHGPGGRPASSGAIARQERIAIHGDYDVDGITSTVILRRALELLGGDVVALHPRAAARRLRPAAGRRSSGCTPRACALIVSVDCGIRGAEAARRARELGVDLIITDHHEPDGDAAAGAGGDQPEAARLRLSRQAPRRRRRRPQAGAGAVRARRPAAAGCRRS